MNVLGEHQVAERLRWPDLIASLRAGFVEGVVAPGRTAHTIEVPGGSPVSLLLMPSWQVGEKIVVKLATVAPDNWKRGPGWSSV